MSSVLLTVCSVSVSVPIEGAQSNQCEPSDLLIYPRFEPNIHTEDNKHSQKSQNS